MARSLATYSGAEAERLLLDLKEPLPDHDPHWPITVVCGSPA